MAYPGIALVAMVGVGLGLALWYLLTDTTTENPHSSGPPPPRRESPPPTNSWEIPSDTRRRRPRSYSRARDDCPICTEPMEQSITTVNCGHVFHQSCITKWRAAQSGENGSIVTCPLCRQSI